MKRVFRHAGAVALCLGLCLALGVALCGCGKNAGTDTGSSTGNGNTEAAQEAAKVVEEAFAALQKGDFVTAQKYMPDLDISELEEAESEDGNRLFLGMLKQALKNMEYEIGDVTQEDDGEAAVEVRVSNLDMSGLAEEYYNVVVDAILEDGDSDGEISDEKMEELLNQLTEDLKKEKKVVSDTIHVEVEDGTIDLSEDELDKMLGGLLSAAEKMDD